jgi:MFS family permease
MLVAIYVPYLVRELRIPAALLGGIFAVAGVGGLLGASLAATVANRAGIGRAMVGGMLLAALAEMVIAVAHGPILLAAALVTLGEAGVQGGDVVAYIANRSARQMVIPDALPGKSHRDDACALRSLRGGRSGVGRMERRPPGLARHRHDCRRGNSRRGLVALVYSGPASA